MPALTFVLMDPPFENERTVTGFRLVEAALRQGFDVTVFAYEGAVSLAFTRQQKHANAVHGNDVDAEDHPLPREWVERLLALAAARGVRLDWVQCGLCVDERGVTESVPGTRRGSPVDLLNASRASVSTLVLPAR